MTTFEVRKIEAVHGRQVFMELLVDGSSLFDEFLISLEDRYKSEMDMIIAYMEVIADNETLPVSKFRKLAGVKDGVME